MEREKLMKREEEFKYIVLWDFDGPVNHSHSSGKESSQFTWAYSNPNWTDEERQTAEMKREYGFAPYDITIEDPELMGLTLRVLEHMNIHSVLGSQRITYPNETPEWIAMHAALNACFGEERAYLTKEEAAIIANDVDPDSTGASKNGFLDNSIYIEGAQTLLSENRILIDDNKNYRDFAIQNGNTFIYAPRDEKDDFFDTQHLAQVLLTVSREDGVENLRDSIWNDPIVDDLIKEKLLQVIDKEMAFRESLSGQQENFKSILEICYGTLGKGASDFERRTLQTIEAIEKIRLLYKTNHNIHGSEIISAFAKIHRFFQECHDNHITVSPEALKAFEELTLSFGSISEKLQSYIAKAMMPYSDGESFGFLKNPQVIEVFFQNISESVCAYQSEKAHRQSAQEELSKEISLLGENTELPLEERLKAMLVLLRETYQDVWSKRGFLETGVKSSGVLKSIRHLLKETNCFRAGTHEWLTNHQSDEEIARIGEKLLVSAESYSLDHGSENETSLSEGWTMV